MTTTTDTTEPTTADSATTPPADTPAPVVQEPAAEPATVDPEQPEQSELPDTSSTDDGDQADDAADDTDPRLSKARQEAKGLRSRLRDAELEVGLHRATLAAMQEAAAAQLAAGRGALADGADLFKAGVQVGDLLAADGTVDPAKVADAVAGVLADRPHWGWQPHKPAGRPREDGTSWYDLVKQRDGAAAAVQYGHPGASGDLSGEGAASWADVLRT